MKDKYNLEVAISGFTDGTTTLPADVTVTYTLTNKTDAQDKIIVENSTVTVTKAKIEFTTKDGVIDTFTGADGAAQTGEVTLATTGIVNITGTPTATFKSSTANGVTSEPSDLTVEAEAIAAAGDTAGNKSSVKVTATIAAGKTLTAGDYVYTVTIPVGGAQVGETATDTNAEAIIVDVTITVEDAGGNDTGFATKDGVIDTFTGADGAAQTGEVTLATTGIVNITGTPTATFKSSTANGVTSEPSDLTVEAEAIAAAGDTAGNKSSVKVTATIAAGKTLTAGDYVYTVTIPVGGAQVGETATDTNAEAIIVDVTITVEDASGGGQQG